MTEITEKQWHILPVDDAKVQSIRKALNIHPVLCRLLALRGISTFEQAKTFFRPQWSDLHDPFLMKGMSDAVSRIQRAIEEDEKIMIYGDYDVDGTTSVAVVYGFLKNCFPQNPLCYYIPHRYREGYGVSATGIQKAAELGCRLIITIDCGIKSVDEVKLAQGHGIDVIICDHHLPGQQLPNAVAILDPKQKDCNYPYKELSGCGIGFKLISALAKRNGIEESAVNKYLDLVATSIGADIVPIDGENRILAYFGLKRANESPCIALQKIKEVAGVQHDWTISDLVFVVAPRINAAGRMDEANKVVSLLLEHDPEMAFEKVSELQKDNAERRSQEQQTTKEAMEILSCDDLDKNRKSTVVFKPNWHKGVVGIVASRLLESYYRPTIVLTESNGLITGSARSVVGFNIHDAIACCSPLLERFGGHFFAAGLTLKPENLTDFKKQFEEVVSRRIQPESLFPKINIDAELSLNDITPSFFKILRQFEPTGPSNPEPIFVSRAVSDVNGNSRIVKDEHIRFVIRQNLGQTITGIGFRLAEKFDVIRSEQPFDIVYHLIENEWKGRKNLEIRVLDIRSTC